MDSVPDPGVGYRKVDPRTLAKLPLPSHVLVWAACRWRTGWLIGRSHEPSGWMGLVQYDDDTGAEVTDQIAAECILSMRLS